MKNEVNRGVSRGKRLKIDSGQRWQRTILLIRARSMNKPFDSIVDIGLTLYVTETDVTTCQPED